MRVAKKVSTVFAVLCLATPGFAASTIKVIEGGEGGAP